MILVRAMERYIYLAAIVAMLTGKESCYYLDVLAGLSGPLSA